MTVQSALYEGTLRHRRFAPAENHFSYPLFMSYLDLDELDEVFAGRWLWSTRRPAFAWFRRRDYLGDPELPLAEAVRRLVVERGGERPGGPIRLLTHLRTFGYLQNPVSFYYCFDAGGERVESIVAEVTNTPWGERHAYVLDRPAAPRGSAGTLRYRHGKQLHVSPFMEMDLAYDWRFTEPARRLVVHIENHRGDERLFDATLVLRRRPIDGPGLARALALHPLMTLRVVAWIYLQAAVLRLKGVPFVAHPDKRGRSAAAGGGA